MNLGIVSIVVTFIGALAMGLVHNGKVMLFGIMMISIGLAIMYLCGVNKGRRV